MAIKIMDALDESKQIDLKIYKYERFFVELVKPEYKYAPTSFNSES